MVRTKPLDDTIRNLVRKSLMAYLEGEKNLKWIVGVIRKSGIQQDVLKQIFTDLKNYGMQNRYQEVLQECHKLGYL